MAEDYTRYATDMARASSKASLDALARQVQELNRRIDQIESRLESAPARRAATDDGGT